MERTAQNENAYAPRSTLYVMRIGIDGSRAFIKNRTGIEEYSYQAIKHLVSEFGEHEIVLYLRKNQKVDFDLPKNWKTKYIEWPRFWTQGGLSLEMLLNPVDTLFVPAHTVPWIHPADSIVAIHGLEYEFCPEAYSLWEKFYMRFSIKNSCRWAKTIIAVSENTKKDLIELYGVPEEKIKVIYEGISNPIAHNVERVAQKKESSTFHVTRSMRYLFFLGRIEQRKNVENIVNAFEILKEQYKIPHKLVLGGKPGFGYGKIKDRMLNVNCAKDIVELGFVAEYEKWELLKNADVFVFPAFYEGFGLPILEAQSVGTSVVTSDVSSIPEVVGDSALLVDPDNAEQIADAIYKIISDEKTKQDLIQKGLENAKRFSWEKCAGEVAEIIF